MQEFDLEALWQSDELTTQAASHYEGIRTQTLDWAQAASQDTLQRLKRHALLEIALGLVVLGVMLYVVWTIPSYLFYLIVLGGSLNVLASVFFFRRFQQQIKTISTRDSKQMLAQYIDCLQSYKNHFWNYTLFTIPTSITIGYLGGWCLGANNDLSILIKLEFLLPFLGLLAGSIVLAYWLARTYFRVFINENLDELKVLKADLDELLT